LRELFFIDESPGDLVVNRAVLQALLPALTALVAALVLLRLVVRVSGARFQMTRIRQLHRSEEGAVQSLSFVLTLPLFIMIVMFIVQVSQLMIGIMGVHYAAFAAARAAIVWTPARLVGNSISSTEEIENELQPPLQADVPINLTFTGSGTEFQGSQASASYKLEKVLGAAAMATAPVSPSRQMVEQVFCPQCGVQPWAFQQMYQRVVPSAQSNSKISERLLNKISYAYWNTRVELAFLDKDTLEGPTYNPRELVLFDGLPQRNDEGEWIREWIPHEVGWQDPIRLTVTHDFALLPGPGRFLAKFIVRADGEPDRVSSRVEIRGGSGDSVPWTRPSYTVPISASATLTNEGFKPLLAYEQNIY
jgi:hypothetical protein